MATTKAAATRKAIKEAGTSSQVRNVHPATKSEQEFRKAMGGS